MSLPRPVNNFGNCWTMSFDYSVTGSTNITIANASIAERISSGLPNPCITKLSCSISVFLCYRYPFKCPCTSRGWQPASVSWHLVDCNGPSWVSLCIFCGIMVTSASVSILNVITHLFTSIDSVHLLLYLGDITCINWTKKIIIWALKFNCSNSWLHKFPSAHWLVVP